MGTDSVRDRFWELPLVELTDREWEQLCDGCGRCCVKKIYDEDSAQLFFTRVICRYFDLQSSRCSCYADRCEKVPDCLQVRDIDWQHADWVPDTCAYRLRQEGKALYSWHPLLSGDRKAMQAAGIAVTERVISEQYVHPESYHEHIIRWISS